MARNRFFRRPRKPAKPIPFMDAAQLREVLRACESERLRSLTVLEPLGRGGFSDVYEVVSRSGEHYALKVTQADTVLRQQNKGSMSEFDRQMLLQKSCRMMLHEAALLQELSGTPHIVQVYETASMDEEYNPCESEEEVAVTLILEELLIDVDEHLKEVAQTEGEMRRLLEQIGKACEPLHEKGVVHRDIKLDNLMWSPQRRQYVVTDLGVSTRPDSGDTLLAQNGNYPPELCDPSVLKGAPVPPSTDLFMAALTVKSLMDSHSIHAGTEFSRLLDRLLERDYLKRTITSVEQLLEALNSLPSLAPPPKPKARPVPPPKAEEAPQAPTRTAQKEPRPQSRPAPEPARTLPQLIALSTPEALRQAAAQLPPDSEALGDYIHLLRGSEPQPRKDGDCRSAFIQTLAKARRDILRRKQPDPEAFLKVAQDAKKQGCPALEAVALYYTGRLTPIRSDADRSRVLTLLSLSSQLGSAAAGMAEEALREEKPIADPIHYRRTRREEVATALAS